MSSLKSKISLSQRYSCTVFSWLIACLKLSISIIICHYYVHQLFTSWAYLNRPQDTGTWIKKESSSIIGMIWKINCDFNICVVSLLEDNIKWHSQLCRLQHCNKLSWKKFQKKKEKFIFFNPICSIILAICNYMLTTKISFKSSLGYVNRKENTFQRWIITLLHYWSKS